jgi:hypothetical protein
MKNNKLSLYSGAVLHIIFFLFIAFGSGEEDRPRPINNKIYTIQEAIKLGFISTQGNGRGTFREVELVINNNTSIPIKLSIDAGMYFENPDPASQSLLSALDLGNLTIEGGVQLKKSIPTFCTDATRSIPSYNLNWNLPSNYNGPLDEMILFYGKFQNEINTWLKKKNPNKFSTRESRLRFFQIVIWCANNGNYTRIASMLAQDVFGNDINRANVWLNDIYSEANQLAQIILRKNNNEFLIWIKNNLNLPERSSGDFSDSGCGVYEENNAFINTHENFTRIWSGKTNQNESIRFQKKTDGEWIESSKNNINYYYTEHSGSGNEIILKDKNRKDTFIALTSQKCLIFYPGVSDWQFVYFGGWSK